MGSAVPSKVMSRRRLNKAEFVGKNHTLEKGLEILSLFSVDTPQLTAHQIRNKLAIPSSTLYRLLRSVRLKRWVEDDGNGRYHLGLRILELARVVRARLDIVDAARAEMVALARDTGETVLLTAVSGNKAVCIDRIEGRHAVRVSMDRGVALPLHAGASSTVLLAFLDRTRRDEIVGSQSLKRFTRHTIVSLKQLHRRLAQIRADGYVFSDQEVDIGVRAIAAPVIWDDHNVLAGLTLVAPCVRMPEARMRQWIPLVTAAARRISAMNPPKRNGVG